MTISVVIPAYNCERYIERCLGSVLSQRGAELDVIVINDGSSDGTGSVLGQYEDRVRILTTENRGSAAARNSGIEMARGDYVMFIDADDWLADGAIERLRGVIDETGADIVKFRYTKIYPDGKEILDAAHQIDADEVVEKPSFKEKIYPLFIEGIKLNSMCVGIYKTSLIAGRRLREDMQVAEDAVFSLGTYTAANKVAMITDVLYFYYQTGTGLTGSGAAILKKYHCNFILAKETSRNLKEWGMNSFGTRIKVYMRPFLLTFDKVGRLLGGKKKRGDDA